MRRLNVIILMRTLVVTVLLFLITLHTVHGGELSYECKVAHLYAVSVNGSLEYGPAPIVEIMKANPFFVSRKNGSLRGSALSLDTSLAKTTRVLKFGSDRNAFEAVADFGSFKNGTHPYQYIRVEEFEPGSVKPFVIMGEAGIVTGTCK